MDTQRLESLLARLPELTLLVVGDYFLDRYLEIDPALAELSLETGLEAHQVVGVRCAPGAAGTVTSNLRSLGVRVRALGVIGDDGEGYELKRALKATGVDITPLVEASGRFTPTYTKPMAGPRELNRLDLKNRARLPAPAENAVIACLRDLMPRVDGVIVVDQVQEEDCGVITRRVRDALAELAGKYHRPFVAESRERLGQFRNVIIQGNAREARQALGYGEQDSVQACGAALFRQNDRPVVITSGENGLDVFDEHGCAHIPAVPVRGPIDIVGAGDSAVAGVAAALSADAALREAALIGNLVASVTIQQLGTTGTAAPHDVLTAFDTWLKAAS